jgi:hypothetical protein
MPKHRQASVRFLERPLPFPRPTSFFAPQTQKPPALLCLLTSAFSSCKDGTCGSDGWVPVNGGGAFGRSKTRLLRRSRSGYLVYRRRIYRGWGWGWEAYRSHVRAVCF